MDVFMIYFDLGESKLEFRTINPGVSANGIASY